MLIGCWQDRDGTPDDEHQDCSKQVEAYYWNKSIKNSASCWFVLYGYFSNLGARLGRVVNATPWPLYPLERPSTHCIRSWGGKSEVIPFCGSSRDESNPVSSATHAFHCIRFLPSKRHVELSLLIPILWQVTPLNFGAIKADSHIACRAHAVSLQCRSLIHTCHAAPLPCSNSAVSFVKVRVVGGNIWTASPTF